MQIILMKLSKNANIIKSLLCNNQIGQSIQERTK